MNRKIINRLLIALTVMVIIIVFMLYRGINQTSIINYIILFFVIIYTLYSAVKQNFILNPYSLFALTPITLFIYDVSVSTHYLKELEQSTYNICIYNFVALLCGLSFANKYGFKVNESSVWLRGDSMNPKKYVVHSYTMLILGLYPTIYGCVTHFGYLISLNLNGMKAAINSAPLASVFQLFLYPAIICSLFSKKRKPIIICFSALALSVLLNFSKTTLVMFVISVLLAIYNQYSIDNKKIFRLVLLGAIALLAFYYSFDFYNSIRHDYDTNAYFNSLGYVGNVKLNWFLPLMYLISPWGNLQYIMNTTINHTYGLWAIKPFLGYLQLDNLFESEYALVPMYSAFNTFSYISCFYRDFGFLGSGIGSFVLGYFIMKIYRLFMRHRKSPFINAIYALNMYATVMLFFSNHYLQLSYPITIVIIMWIYLRLFVSKETDYEG